MGGMYWRVLFGRRGLVLGVGYSCRFNRQELELVDAVWLTAGVPLLFRS